MDLRESQIVAIRHMLQLNQVEQQGQSAWKVLIYDDTGRDVIAPLMNVGELREQGVTLHLSLHANRLAVPDVPAVYFVCPTEANVERIERDLKQALYDQVHLNFIGSLSSSLLERLVDAALASDSVARVARVHDQFVGFQALAPSLFSLALPLSFVAFNDPKIADAVAQANIQRCVDGLFAVLSVAGVTPIIRCARNGAAEMVARGLSSRLHQHLQTSQVGTSAASFRRPLLVLLERTVDLATMMHHPWTYSAMVHDMLGLELNRVTVPASDTNPKEVTYDLDARDQFWAAQGGSPFQTVAFEVKQQLGHLKERLARLDEIKDKGDAGSELGDFVTDIPVLNAKQAVIEAHTTIATALLQQIKRRELDRFYAIEESLLARGSCDRAELRHLLGGDSGTESDRARLLVVYYLCAVERAPAGSTVGAEFSKLEAGLRDAGVDLTPLDYVRQARAHLGSLSLPTMANDAEDAPAAPDGPGGDAPSWSALQKGYESLSSFSSIFSDGVEKLKTLLPREQELPVTRIVRALMERKPNKSVDQYLHFDPHTEGGRAQTGDVEEGGSPYREAIVFVIGGGNYIEYQNLSDYAAGALAPKSKRSAPVSSKTILYGSTELITSGGFIEQIATLTK